ncbi:MAG: hypothetical protein H0T68_08245 [Gemmatimonadales bacterium]|nr:hypothetical protein [Gemmatimonadales bacterium]
MTLTPRRIWQALAILAVWTAVALLAAGQRHFFQAAIGRPAPFADSLLGALPSCWLWAAFTPAILWLAHRVRVERRNWIAALVLHGAFSSAAPQRTEFQHERRPFAC